MEERINKRAIKQGNEQTNEPDKHAANQYTKELSTCKP